MHDNHIKKHSPQSSNENAVMDILYPPPIKVKNFTLSDTIRHTRACPGGCAACATRSA